MIRNEFRMYLTAFQATSAHPIDDFNRLGSWYRKQVVCDIVWGAFSTNL